MTYERATVTSNLSAIQLVSGCCAEKNLVAIKEQLAVLSPQKNQLVLLPENALCYASKSDYLKLAEPLGKGAFQTQLAKLAEQYRCYLVCGSFPIRIARSNKIYTTSLAFSPSGMLISHYHKIHLFDAMVSDQQGTYRESDTFIAGNELAFFDWETEQGIIKVGLAICYDLRFPALFQTLRQQGADIILLPAAFTQVTGDAHWLALLQARAIETQCYIIAANQGGNHPCGRQTYGHSMILSPWGDILKKMKKNEGSICVPFEQSTLDEIRTNMPIMAHNRFTTVLK